MKPLNFYLTQTVMVLALLLSLPLMAQERSAGTPPSVSGDSSTQQSLAVGLKANLVSLTNAINNTCTGGQTHGQTWTIGCGTGFTGNQTLVCIHGETAVQSSTCKSAMACADGHQSGQTWTGSCPTGTTGQMTYQCIDGNIVLNNAGTTCSAHDCQGTSYTQACPTTVDGIQMTGTMTYACTNNVLNLTGNSCHTFGKPCGATQSGQSTSANCSTYSSGLAGNLTLTCNDGNTYISGLSCSGNQQMATCAPSSLNPQTMADGTTISAACPNGLSGNMTVKCSNGVAGATDVSQCMPKGWHDFAFTMPANNNNCNSTVGTQSCDMHNPGNCYGSQVSNATTAGSCNCSRGSTGTYTICTVVVQNITNVVYQLANIPVGSQLRNVVYTSNINGYGAPTLSLTDMVTGADPVYNGSGYHTTCDNAYNAVNASAYMTYSHSGNAIASQNTWFVQSDSGSCRYGQYTSAAGGIKISGEAYY